MPNEKMMTVPPLQLHKGEFNAFYDIMAKRMNGLTKEEATEVIRRVEAFDGMARQAVELKAENEKLKDELGLEVQQNQDHDFRAQRAFNQRNAALAEAEKLREWVKTKGEHADGCSATTYPWDIPSCTCGLSALLKEKL